MKRDSSRHENIKKTSKEISLKLFELFYFKVMLDLKKNKKQNKGSRFLLMDYYNKREFDSLKKADMVRYGFGDRPRVSINSPRLTHRTCLLVELTELIRK